MFTVLVATFFVMVILLRYCYTCMCRFLNDFNSPACQQCVRFVANIDLESLVTADSKEGFKPMLAHLAQVNTISHSMTHVTRHSTQSLIALCCYKCNILYMAH